VRPPFQPIVKGQVAYPLPWDIAVSATFQSLPGPEQRAQYPLSNDIARPSLGRNFTSVPPTVDLEPAGTLYGDRVYQTDLRISRMFRTGGMTIRPTFSVYNLFNANPALTYNPAYSFNPALPTQAPWPRPQTVLTPRFAKISAQIDF
jgi:hypothetical protein